MLDAAVMQRHQRTDTQSVAKVVVVAAPKGGVGKTTLAMALLVSARRNGLRTVGINMDEQQTLTRWGQFRAGQIAASPEHNIPDIAIFSHKIDDYRQVIKEATSRYDFIVIDTPPGHSHYRNAVQQVCQRADIVLIPTSSSDLDVDEVIPFRRGMTGERAVFVLNNVNRRATSVQTAQQRLLKAGKVCPVLIPRLEVIASQYRLGLTSQDTKERGALEFEAVWDFVSQEFAS